MILRSIKAYEVRDRNFETVSPTTHLREIIHKIESTRESYYMVVDRNRCLRGVISLQDLRGFLTKSGLDDLVIAEDIAHTDIVTVEPDDNLEKVRSKFALQDLQLLPVVEPRNGNRIIAVLRYNDMMTVYNKRLIETLSG
jgi:CIC family chloride channel protein